MALRYLFILIVLTACFHNKPPAEPTIIYVPSQLPPLSDLLTSIGTEISDPILAEGEEFEVRRSDLIRFLIQKYGQESIEQLVRREAAIRQIRRSHIEVSAEQIENRAYQILNREEIGLSDYLDTRGIDRVTWVNEISVLLGIEQLCRNEMLKEGAVLVRYAHYQTEAEALESRIPEKQPAEWIAPFMIESTLVKEALFSEPTPEVVYDGQWYWVLQIVDRVPPTREKSPFYAARKQKIQSWSPTQKRLEQYLNHLLSLQKVEFLKDRLYHELSLKQVGSS